MSVRNSLKILVIPLLLAGACGDESRDGEICTSAQLSTALAEAGPGDTVTVGRCRIADAAITVPAGVILVGEDREASVLVAAADGVAVRLMPGSPATELRNLTIESDGRTAVLAQGAGNVRLADLSVRATRGIGVRIEDATQATIATTALVGPVDAANAATIAADADYTSTAVAGIALVAVADAQIDGLTVNGFASVGALFVESTTTWSGGDACRNRQIGLMVEGGAVTLHGVSLCETFRHSFNAVPAYGAVFTAGAEVESTGLDVSDGGGYGLLHNAVQAHHVNLVANDNREAAIWVQRSDRFEVEGTATQLSGNRLAGIVVFESSNVSIRDARIQGTRATTHIVNNMGVEVGDGIQIVSSTESIALSDLTLVDNERVGILVELDGADASGATLENVAVTGEGEQLGVIAQGGTVPGGWDAGVERTGAALANDAAFDGTLPIVEGLVGPTDLPPEVDGAGLDALVGPTD